MIHVLEKKKHFAQGCAGLIVHALLTVYTDSSVWLWGGGVGVLSCVVDHIL
jgi:hypothetical protein